MSVTFSFTGTKVRKISEITKLFSNYFADILLIIIWDNQIDVKIDLLGIQRKKVLVPLYRIVIQWRDEQHYSWTG